MRESSSQEFTGSLLRQMSFGSWSCADATAVDAGVGCGGGGGDACCRCCFCWARRRARGAVTPSALLFRFRADLGWFPTSCDVEDKAVGATAAVDALRRFGLITSSTCMLGGGGGRLGGCWLLRRAGSKILDLAVPLIQQRGDVLFTHRHGGPWSVHAV